MLISLSTGCLYKLSLHRVCEMAAISGFDGVELIINQNFAGGDPVALTRSLQNIIPVHTIHAPFMMLNGWGDYMDSLKRSVELAAECGISLVNFHPPSWMGMEISFWRKFSKIQDFQKEVGLDGRVIVTLENMPWVGDYKINPNILSKPEKMIRFIEEHNLFMTFDCTHMGSGHTNFINDFYLFYESGRIRNIHFSDYGHGREHLLPGHGVLPLTRFLNHLRNTEYQSFVTVELDSREFPKGEHNIIESLKEILLYLRKETAQTQSSGSSHTNSSEALQVLPP